MPARVAIIGVGYSDVRSTTPGISYKEMMFEAATRAYADADVAPRRDVNTFVTAAEDYWEGTSIFDEYVPDQLGAAQRPTHTISGDGIQALLAAAMQIETGFFDVAVVEAHSKASNVRNPDRIVAFGLDPIWTRPLNFHPAALAGLEMRRFLSATGNSVADCAQVVVKNRRSALANPLAAYPASLTIRDVVDAPRLAEPIGFLDRAPLADGCFVVVLASAERARVAPRRPVWIAGGAWMTETAALETRDWVHATYARLCADRAYAEAGIIDPPRQIDVAEIDDSFSYKELQHLEAVRLALEGMAGRDLASGRFDRNGDVAVNPSGGHLGAGHLLEASGLRQVVEIVQQLRGEAGSRQVPGARTGMALSWRGLPTTTASAVVLSGGN
jgi:acetyl-CoA C-acetyltransferase